VRIRAIADCCFRRTRLVSAEPSRARGFAMPSESENAHNPAPDQAEDESPRTSHAARSPCPSLREAEWGSSSEDGPKSSAPQTFKQGSSICIFELFPECTPPMPSVDVSIAPRCSPICIFEFWCPPAPCIEVPTALTLAGCSWVWQLK
jgi:hypothetical protein